jgi:hypothetical protein
MEWTIRKRMDQRKEAVCVHGIGHGVDPHACDECCMSDPQFPLDEIRPVGMAPIAIQQLPQSVLRMSAWDTPGRVLAELETVDALTTQELADRYPALDLAEATSWLNAQGLVQTGLNHQLARIVTITSFGRSALKMLRARAGVYG